MIVAYTEYGIHAIKPNNIVLLAIQVAVIILSIIGTVYDYLSFFFLMHCPSVNGSDYLVYLFNSLLMVILFKFLQKEVTILFSGIHKELELYLYIVWSVLALKRHYSTVITIQPQLLQYAISLLVSAVYLVSITSTKCSFYLFIIKKRGM